MSILGYIILIPLVAAGLIVFAAGILHKETLLQGGAASQDRLARVAHNHEVVGSNPTPATNWPVVGPKSTGSSAIAVAVGTNNAGLASCPGDISSVASRVVAQPAKGGSEIPPASFIEPEDLRD